MPCTGVFREKGKPSSLIPLGPAQPLSNPVPEGVLMKGSGSSELDAYLATPGGGGARKLPPPRVGRFARQCKASPLCRGTTLRAWAEA